VVSCFRTSIDRETQWESHLLASRQMTSTPNTPLPTVNKPGQLLTSSQPKRLPSAPFSRKAFDLHIISRPYRTERKTSLYIHGMTTKRPSCYNAVKRSDVYAGPSSLHWRVCRICGSIMRRHMLFFKFSRYIAFFWIGVVNRESLRGSSCCRGRWP
jgi:hypothetical protein